MNLESCLSLKIKNKLRIDQLVSILLLVFFQLELWSQCGIFRKTEKYQNKKTIENANILMIAKQNQGPTGFHFASLIIMLPASWANRNLASDISYNLICATQRAFHFCCTAMRQWSHALQQQAIGQRHLLHLHLHLQLKLMLYHQPPRLDRPDSTWLDSTANQPGSSATPVATYV